MTLVRVGAVRARTDREGRRRAFRAALAAAAVAACCGTVALAAPSGGVPADSSLASCFWEGPISMKEPTTRGFDGHNFNYPEESATYWLARFRLPEGTKLFLRGRYAHARYESLNSYSAGEPIDALPDVKTAPLPGSSNPFLPGHRRDLKRRSYVVEVRDAVPPAAGEPRDANTLYARPAGGASIELL